ncbi:MAG TPA: lanthionine synthetase LanC family protein [Longimicrobiaceae bacterium]|nr:lanthionine synthetase LanC family protein [Longimicrobiaceae bacterium]
MTDPRSTAPGGGAFLEAAARIGARLAHEAVWADGACTWTVMVPDRSVPGGRAVVAAPAGGALYQGVAGIGLFLAELAALTGDVRVARAAEGAIRHALAEGERLPHTAFGLHGGRVGIAWAAVRAAQLQERDDFRAAAWRLLEPLEGKESLDRGTDVIGGAAGAVPALLGLAGVLEPERLRGMARRLGDHLVATAVREPDGWSWVTMPGSTARNLNGYAHGAAGCGYALLELFHATGEGRFRYGAEQAFAYERRTYSPELGNWPDLRHLQLSEYVQAGRVDELRALAQSEEGFPAQSPHFMSAWCHGAPGIGLTRLRAWQLLGDEVHREEAEGAVRATLRSLEDPRMNYSLCHGRAGNCETLLLAADVLGDASLRERAEACLREGCEASAAGEPWASGTMGAVPDPSLLLGEAGIGHFLLRLHSPAVPSVLLVTAPGTGAAAGGGDEHRAMAASELEAYFGRTLRLFRALGKDTATLEEAARSALPLRSPVAAVHAALDEPAGPDAALLEDASLLDRAGVELSRSVEDYTREYLDGLVRTAAVETPWGDEDVSLSPRVRVVHSGWMWDEWLHHGAAAAGPERGDVFFLLQASAGRVTVRRLSPFAAVVLDAVRSPASLDEVIGRVGEAISGGEPPDPEWLRPRVLEQLREAHRAGFVNRAPARATATA